MAFMENIKAKFDDVHNEIVQKLRDAHLASLPSGKTLTTGDYKDPARALRRYAQPCLPLLTPHLVGAMQVLNVQFTVVQVSLTKERDHGDFHFLTAPENKPLG
jgi:hypothetical protein